MGGSDDLAAKLADGTFKALLEKSPSVAALPPALANLVAAQEEKVRLRRVVAEGLGGRGGHCHQ